MGRLLAALNTLGAVRQRDGSLSIELAELGVTSLFGGGLAGDGACVVQGDALAFRAPLELAACGRLWLPDIVDDEALRAAVLEAHDELRSRIDDALGTLRRLGFKARLQAPDPRARGTVQVDGATVVVAIDTSGDLVVETVDGRPVPSDQRRSLAAPEEATAGEAAALVADVVRAVKRRSPATPMMSQEELDELQAALDSDEDLASSDEAEPTAAGVPMPTRPTRNIPSDFDDGGTLQLPIPNDHTQQIGAEDSDIGTLKVKFDARDVAAARAGRPSTPQATSAPVALPRERSLLDEFDDDMPAEPPPPLPMPRGAVDVDVDVDFDSEEADSFADAPEPTATRPHAGAATRQAPTQLPPTRQAPAVDDEENDLLAALGDDDAIPPPVGDGFDDFPALDVDGPGFAGVPTSVNAADEMIASAPPTAAAMPPPRARPSINDFDDDVTGAIGPIGGTDDDFDDGKTRALVVDEALLARLKLGDAQADPPRPPVIDLRPDAPSSAEAPAVALEAGTDFIAEGPFDDSDEGGPAIGTSDEADDSTPPADDVAAALDDDRSDEQTSAHPDDGEGDLASLLDDEPDPPTLAAAEPPLPPAIADDDPDDDDGELLIELLAREQALVRELDAVRAQIAAARGRAEVTDHAALNRRSQVATVMPTRRPTQPTTPTVAPRSSSSGAVPRATSLPSSSPSSSPASTPSAPPAPRSSSSGAAARPSVGSDEALDERGPTRPVHGEFPPDRFAVVGASADHSAEGETSTAAPGASLQSLQSVDVHEIAPPPGLTTAPKPTALKHNGLLDALDGFDDVDDDGVTAAAVDSRSSAADDDDLVSLAALQGALKEMGVDLDTGAQTQVAAAAMPFALPDDADGDVFGSGGTGASAMSLPSELSSDSTRVRQTRPSSIGIVVEDERARVRLRKHLVDRFADLVEASDASAVVQLRELAHLDAIVFVRPTDNEPTRAGFERLSHLPRRPRVLVISGNELFDELAAVDLRLPLAQKASEVARQVLEGLERLGIQSSPTL